MTKFQEGLGAFFGEGDAKSKVLHYGDSSAEYAAARGEAIVVDRSDRGKLTFRGEDRASFLQGMLTNTVEGLRPGSGNHSALTDLKGNTQADLWVYNAGETIQVETEPGVQSKVSAFLDRYIIADDVEVTDTSSEFSIVGVQGPRALEIVREFIGNPLEIDMNGVISPEQGGEIRLVTRRSYTGEDGYDLWVLAEKAASVFQKLVDAGAVPAGEDVLEILRIESGIPKYGVDLDDRVVPLEAGIPDTVDFGKGCFIGQEVLGKMHNLGKPRRFLVGLFTEDLIDRETELNSGEKVVGLVKSSARSVALERIICLASVRRGFEEPGTILELPGGGQAEVASLPFAEGKSLTISDLNLSA
jgi:folate-binding protein YgfZ